MLFIFTLAAVSAPAQASEIRLTLHRALFVEGPENSQPSGLALCNGTLLAVSDRHDDTVFRVRIGPDAAHLEPHVTFSAPQRQWGQRLDFEGITCDEKGNLFLVSETLCRILRITPDGGASWITPSLTPQGRARGLFQVDNAYLEGIALISPDLFVLCAERQPRGFVEVDLSSDPLRVRAYTADTGIFPFAAGRSPDFSDLTVFRDTLYVLERNAFVIAKLERRGVRWEESATGWYYGDVVQQPALRYADMRYGKAEGLCMDERFVYLILDNNGVARALDPSDRRPLLLIFLRPETP